MTDNRNSQSGSQTTAPVAEASHDEVEQRVRVLADQVNRATATVVERSLELECAESALRAARERSDGLVDCNPLPGRAWYRARVHGHLALPAALTLSPHLERCRHHAERMSPSELSSAIEGDRTRHRRWPHRIGDLLTVVWLMWFRVPRLRLLAAPIVLSMSIYRVVLERVRLHTRGVVHALTTAVAMYVMFMAFLPLGLAFYHLAFVLLVLAPSRLLFGGSAEGAVIPFLEVWVAGFVLGVLLMPSVSWPSFVLRRWVLADRLEALIAEARREVGAAMVRRDSARAALEQSIARADRVTGELENAERIQSPDAGPSRKVGSPGRRL